MAEVNNYARNIRTKMTVFARKGDGSQWWRSLGDVKEWAFWSVPEGQRPEDFDGRLVSEDPMRRCARTGHRLRLDACDTCRAKRLAEAADCAKRGYTTYHGRG